MAAMGSARIKIIPEIDPAELDAAMVEAIAVRVAEILARSNGFGEQFIAGMMSAP